MMNHDALVALVLLEPLGLIALVAPVALVFLGWSRGQNRQVFLGTVRFFPQAHTEGRDQRLWRLPAWLVAAAVALSLAALALAKPGYEPPPAAGVVVDVLLDKSPSMFHPLDPGSGSSERRIDRAIVAFQDWARGVEEGLDGSVFVRVDGGAIQRWQDLQVPSVPAVREPEPLWLAADQRGAVWITDGVIPSNERVHAGLFASGGQAVPGPISAGPAGVIVWLGGERTEFRRAPEQGLLESGTLVLDSRAPELVRELGEIWAADRGMRIATETDQAALVLTLGPELGAKALEPMSVGRDGWQAEVFVGSRPALAGPNERLGADEPWLLDSAGAALVTYRPGRVTLAFSSFAAVPRDLAAFAVSWTALFDKTCLAPQGVLDMAERRSAGDGLAAPPMDLPVIERLNPADRVEDMDTPAAAIRAVLAGLAGALALLALVLLARGQQGQPGSGAGR